MTSRNLNLVQVVVAIMLLALLSACQTAAAESIPEGRIKIGGSTSTEPLVALLAEEFMKQNPNVEITVRGGGSGLGVKGVGYEGFHIGMVSRPLKAEEIEKWPNMQAIPIARAGVAVVISTSLYNSGVQQLTFEQLINLWQEEYNNWTQLGSSTGLSIRVFDREIGSGTHSTFVDTVFDGDDTSISDDLLRLATSNEVLGAISSVPGAVSILSVGLQAEDVVGVSIVDKSGQVIAPTLDNVTNGSYPILQDLYLVINGSPQGWEKEFIDFVLSPQGQQLVKDAGYGSVSVTN